MSGMERDEQESLTRLMAQAVLKSVEHVRSGGLPFVGIVVDVDGRVSAPGTNMVARSGDPTAHAEIVTLRSHLDATGQRDLTGAKLLATGEPCSLCYRYAEELGVTQVIYAVSSDEAAAWGFDYRDPRQPARALRTTAKRLPVPRAMEPFRLFHELHQPTSTSQEQP